MSVKFLRIDDRLIHGQVCVAWVKSYQAKRVLIVDTAVSKDTFLIDVMKMVAPSGIELAVEPCENVEELVAKYDHDDKNTIILVKTPEVAEALFDGGLKIQSLNVGGMGAKKERSQLYKNVSASESEVETLKRLEARGIDVYFQTTPSNAVVKLSSLNK